MNSLVKFCEPKFEKSEYIYEFYNTISNFIFIAICYTGYDKNKKSKYAYFSLGGVGIGSSLLHGFGNYTGQMIDEFFMLIFIINIIILFKESDTKIIISYNSVGLIIYIYFRIYNIFLFLFASQIFYLAYILHSRIEKNTKEKYLIKTSFLIFFIGTFLWILEQNFCDYFPFFKWFHPVWHITSGLSSYLLLKANKIYIMGKKNSYIKNERKE